MSQPERSVVPEESDQLLGALRSERARLRLALEASGLGNWELDLDSGESPQRSQRHDAIFGYEEGREDWSLDIFLDHVHPDDRPRVRESMVAAIELGRPWDFECRIRRADGEARWIWARGETHEDPLTGRRMYGVVADITDRKRIEERHRVAARADAFRVALNDALRPLVDAAAVQAAAAQELGRFLGATRVHYAEVSEDQAWGTVRAEYAVEGVGSVVGRHHFDDFGPVLGSFREGRTVVTRDVQRDPAFAPEEAARVVALGIQAFVLVPLVKKGQAVAILVVHQAEPRDWSDPEIALIEETAERTWEAVERGRAEIALREAKEAAEEANRAKSDFLAAMSHELRTPLNAISGYADLMDAGVYGALNERQQEAVTRIHRSQQHLLGLINEILNFTRLETGAVHYEVGDVSVAEVFESARALMAPAVDDARLTLSVAAPRPDVLLRADPEKLLQILLNLLSNAVKFNDPGGRIEVTCEPAGTLARIRVRDTGIGIPDDRLDDIFEPFVQVRSDLARSRDGTGLGLAISRDVAVAMGGGLTVTSEVGRGSTFTLTLPTATPG